jgi:hypothetical protein
MGAVGRAEAPKGLSVPWWRAGGTRDAGRCETRHSWQATPVDRHEMVSTKRSKVPQQAGERGYDMEPEDRRLPSAWVPTSHRVTTAATGPRPFDMVIPFTWAGGQEANPEAGRLFGWCCALVRAALLVAL